MRLSKGKSKPKMTDMKQQLIRVLFVSLCLGPLSAWAQANGFPSKAVRIIVPFPAGGSADALARVVGQELSKRWSQPVLIENKPGGGTVIAGALAAKSPPDGHTLLLIANSLTINAKLRTNMPYDGLKAFAPVALLVRSPQVIAVNSASPYKTLAELLQDAKAKPGVLSYATVGPATTQHIAGEAFKHATGTDFNYVPYTGGALAANAVSGGHATMVLTNLNEVAGLLEAGKLRPLAVTSRERLEVLPQVPTVIEQGYKDYEAAVWYAFATPAGTDPEIIQKIANELQRVLQDSPTRTKLLGASLYPNYSGPKELAAHIEKEFARYSQIIDKAGIKLD
jgi:tripartite-type tricarboxylate transporter receptor subunit TctC